MSFVIPAAGREKEVARGKRSVCIRDDRSKERNRGAEGQTRGNRMGTMSEIRRTRARQITTERYSSALKWTFVVSTVMCTVSVCNGYIKHILFSIIFRANLRQKATKLSR